jgi:hypothetical protein
MNASDEGYEVPANNHDTSATTNHHTHALFFCGPWLLLATEQRGGSLVCG